MDPGHEVAGMTGERAEQGDPEHAAGLPSCVEDAGGDARARLLDARQQRRRQRRNQQAIRAARRLTGRLIAASVSRAVAEPFNGAS